METYHVIGVMSGTSLDGVDIAYCEFHKTGDEWSFAIINAETLRYEPHWKNILSGLENKSALEFARIHMEYGHYIGKAVKEFINRNVLEIDFVCSHGHTIFHQPENKLTVQIGSGAAIAAECRLPVVCDFRSVDVALGGQGAFLVPIGDKLLFHQYDFCLNLGGFANISFEEKRERTAFDICPVNIVLNALASQAGKEYDSNGEMAQSGVLNEQLLMELNELNFYSKTPPKSLGKEWVLRFINPLLEKYSIPLNDKIRTVTEHVAMQISAVLKKSAEKNMLITGGGAYNQFLIQRIRDLSSMEIKLPADEVIDNKEALIFAFLGVLRMRKQINCLSSVTGAESDNVGGAVYRPFS